MAATAAPAATVAPVMTSTAMVRIAGAGARAAAGGDAGLHARGGGRRRAGGGARRGAGRGARRLTRIAVRLPLAKAGRGVLREDQRHCRRGNQQYQTSHVKAPQVWNPKAGVDSKVRIFPVNRFDLGFSDFPPPRDSLGQKSGCLVASKAGSRNARKVQGADGPSDQRNLFGSHR
jgi:hypothetical protein